MTNRDEFVKNYMDCMSRCKTEREWVTEAELIALKHGFSKFNYKASGQRPASPR